MCYEITEWHCQRASEIVIDILKSVAVTGGGKLLNVKVITFATRL